MAFFMKHETDHEQIKERIVSAANMPKDVMLGASVLTILGNFEVCIENYRGILESVSYTHLEDVFPMLYLKYRLTGRAKQQKIKHLVIDEMQDYSYLQYTICLLYTSRCV